MPSSPPSSSIPRTIWAIGCMSLLMNISNVVIFSLFPLYLNTILGMNHLTIGLFEGIAEAFTWLIRPFAGFISDVFSKRKPLLMSGAFLGFLSRFLLASCPTLMGIILARSTDRLGNGLQATPREALVGDHAPKHLKGSCYGLRQTLSVVGSVLGSVALIFWLNHAEIDYVSIFWWAALPSFLAVLVVYFFVQESPVALLRPERMPIIQHLRHIKDLKASFWRVLCVAFIFMMSNYSGAFLILKGQSLAQNPSIAPEIMIYQNIATMLIAFPIGRLSDKMDRRLLLAIGFLLTVASNLCIGFAPHIFVLLIGAALWGAQLGITQSLLLTKVADHTSPDLRGTAFGLYYVCMGFSVFLANAQAGWGSHEYGAAAPFVISSAYALLALVVLPVIKSRRQEEGPSPLK